MSNFDITGMDEEHLDCLRWIYLWGLSSVEIFSEEGRGKINVRKIKEPKIFRLSESPFFSLPPVDLGKTTARDHDAIIAKEAYGKR